LLVLPLDGKRREGGRLVNVAPWPATLPPFG